MYITWHLGWYLVSLEQEFVQSSKQISVLSDYNIMRLCLWVENNSEVWFKFKRKTDRMHKRVYK